MPTCDGWEAEISLARILWRYCHVGTAEKGIHRLVSDDNLVEGSNGALLE
jgi:hypothetical protein